MGSDRYLVIVDEAIPYPHEGDKVEVNLSKDPSFDSGINGLSMLGDQSSGNVFVPGGETGAIVVWGKLMVGIA